MSTVDIPPVVDFASILKEMLIESGWLVKGTKTGRMSCGGRNNDV